MRPNDHDEEAESGPIVPASAPSTGGSARRRRLPARCRRCGRFVEGAIPELCPGCGAVHCPFCQATEGCEHRFAEVTDEGIYPHLVTDTSAPRLSRDACRSLTETELREAFGDLFELLWQAYAPDYDGSPSLGVLADSILQYHCVGAHTVLCDFERVGRGPGSIRYYFARDPEDVKRQFADVLDELRAGFQRADVVAGRVPEDHEGEEDTASEADRQVHAPSPPRPRSAPGGAGRPLRRSRRGTLPPSIILVDCDGARHRVSFPRRGPVVLLDHPDRAAVEAALAANGALDGCLGVLKRVRVRSSNRPWGWYMWLVHIAPRFGQAGWTIRERLRELDERRKLRRLLRDVDLA